MQSSCLMLIDWEGLKLAPVEADLFIFWDKPFWKQFLTIYTEIRKDFSISKKRLAFYLYRRRIEDVWGFMERILFDSITDQERNESLMHIERELQEIERVETLQSCFSDQHD